MYVYIYIYIHTYIHTHIIVYSIVLAYIMILSCLSKAKWGGGARAVLEEAEGHGGPGAEELLGVENVCIHIYVYIYV